MTLNKLAGTTLAVALFVIGALIAGCSSQQPWGNARDYAAQGRSDPSASSSYCFWSNDPFCDDYGRQPEVIIVEQRPGFEVEGPGLLGGGLGGGGSHLRLGR